MTKASHSKQRKMAAHFGRPRPVQVQGVYWIPGRYRYWNPAAPSLSDLQQHGVQMSQYFHLFEASRAAIGSFAILEADRFATARRADDPA